MNTREIISALDSEIARLQQARQLIAAAPIAARQARRTKAEALEVPPAKKRVLSAEGRRNIAAGQKKRWAKQQQAKKLVEVTKLPSKQQRERKPRAASRAAASHALSSRSDMIAVAATKPTTDAAEDRPSAHDFLMS